MHIIIGTVREKKLYRDRGVGMEKDTNVSYTSCSSKNGGY